MYYLKLTLILIITIVFTQSLQTASQKPTVSSYTYNQTVCQVTSSLNPLNHQCQVRKEGFESINYHINGFSQEGEWLPKTSKEEMLSWIVDAREAFNRLGIGTQEKSITIQLHKDLDAPGLVHVSGRDSIIEDGQTLHLISGNRLKAEMKVTTIHEYFHHAQVKTLLEEEGENFILPHGIFSKADSKNFYNIRWLLEGTALWFEDYLYDDMNSYKDYYAYKIPSSLSKGLTNNTYESFLLFKLFSSRCQTFDAHLKNLFYPTTTQKDDPYRVKNLERVLRESECSFENYLTVSDSTLLEKAFADYTYTTLLEQNLTKIESDEKSDVHFPMLFSFDRDKISRIKKVYSTLPLYSVKSFQINNPNREEEKSSFKLTIKTDNPLLLLVVSIPTDGSKERESFSFRTESGKLSHYSFQPKERTDRVSIHLINATEREVHLNDFNLISDSSTQI